MNLPEVHGRALEFTERFVVGVRADQWDQPSVCSEWDVRSLVNHVVKGNWWVPELVGGKSIEEVGDRFDGDRLGDDPTATYVASAEAASSAFKSPRAMERMVGVSYGPVPGEMYCGHRFIDVLIHGWDIAVSTGQDATLDPDLVAECWQVVEPQRAILESSGAFGSDLSIPADADRQTQLLAVLGRRV